MEITDGFLDILFDALCIICDSFKELLSNVKQQQFSLLQ
jgi:hypothetical protein